MSHYVDHVHDHMHSIEVNTILSGVRTEQQKIRE